MKPTVALLVMSPERRLPLLKKLKPLNTEVVAVENCQQLRSLLESQPPVDVVITEVTLADGNWCDVFRYLVDHGVHASVIVSSPRADEILWSEVLWRGAYDLLVEPYESDEVRHTLEGALRASDALRSLPQAVGGLN